MPSPAAKHAARTRQPNVYQFTSRHLAEEWVETYRTTLLFLKELFQYEASRSTKITKTEGSNTTLPGN